VEQLFEAFVRAKQEAGEEMGKMTRAGFNEFVRKKTKDLQTQKNCNEVEYVVETVDGQVETQSPCQILEEHAAMAESRELNP